MILRCGSAQPQFHPRLKFAKELYRHLRQSSRFEELNLEVAITALVASMSGYSAAPEANRGSRFQVRC